MILRSGIDIAYSPRIDLDNSLGPLQEEAGSVRLFVIITGTSAVVLSTAYNRSQVTLLGLLSTLLISFTLVLLENILNAAPEKGGRQSNGGSSGGFARRRLSLSAYDDGAKTAIRDTAAAVFVVCFAASFMVEGPLIQSLATPPSLRNIKHWPEGWRTQLFFWGLGRNLGGIIIEMARSAFTFAMVSCQRRHADALSIIPPLLRDHGIVIFHCGESGSELVIFPWSCPGPCLEWSWRFPLEINPSRPVQG
jgi:hypothetical protein